MLWIFDIEIYKNYFNVIFKNPNTSDIKKFTIYKDKNDIKELVSFISDKNKWLVGYNNYTYDNQILSFLFKEYPTLLSLNSNEICIKLYGLSQNIILNSEYSDYKYNLPFRSIDLMKAGGLMKSLKLVGVSLKWPILQDLPIPFDQEITDNDIELMDKYNLNDVEITEKLYFHLLDKLKMRYDISTRYNINAYTEPDSGIANKLLEKFYSEDNNLSIKDFKDLRTKRPIVRFRDIIFPHIKFKSEIFNDLLTKMFEFTYYESKPFFSKSVMFDGLKYKLGIGGLHSVDKGDIFESTDTIDIIDCDVTSMYPSIMINHSIKPKHISNKFINRFKEIYDIRVKAKHEGDNTINDAFKIVLNSTYGKMKFKNHWLYDPLAALQITINGQLYLLMLIEKLVLSGFKVISANTDGVLTIVNKKDSELYYKICEEWEKETYLNLEYTKYEKYIRKDVNNYIAVVNKDKIKYKGIFLTDINLQKGFDKPIISIALYNYFIKGIPIEITVKNHTDIYDFCIAKKIDSKFNNEFHYLKNSERKIEHLQKSVRFYISTDGGKLLKVDAEDNKHIIEYVVGKRVTIFNNYVKKEIENYNIDYNYYISEIYKIIYKIKDFQLKLF